MLRPNTSISSELTPPPLISLSVARCCLRMNGRFAPQAVIHICELKFAHSYDSQGNSALPVKLGDRRHDQCCHRLRERRSAHLLNCPR
jgi:hypothetical protein